VSLKKHMQDNDFLKKLQKEAEFQAQLENKRVLPKRLDFFTSFVAMHTWQVVLGAAFVTAVVLEVGK